VTTALITGIDGQDGSCLAELLIKDSCNVVGVAKPDEPLRNIDPAKTVLNLQSIDLCDAPALAELIARIKPDQLYHLGAPSFVATDPSEDHQILEAITLGTQAVLSAVADGAPACRVFLAGSSEMFGAPDKAPQNEATAFRPRSIYGLAKVCAHQALIYYRRRYGLFACTGFLYNHESPRRGERFVTRKITAAAARISRGLQDTVQLGDLDALRDWGYAPDYVTAMQAMLQNDRAEDFVIATGQLHSVRDLAERAFARVNLDYQQYVAVDPSLVRAGEEVPLVGDARAIKKRLGWSATRPFGDIIDEMVDCELRNIGVEQRTEGA
jgi:GDPmannose 4,6-dehydratase